MGSARKDWRESEKCGPEIPLIIIANLVQSGTRGDQYPNC